MMFQHQYVVERQFQRVIDIIFEIRRQCYYLTTHRRYKLKAGGNMTILTTLRRQYYKLNDPSTI